MSTESAPNLQLGSLDPSLMGGQQQMGVIDPSIHALITNPDSVVGAERENALKEARRLSGGLGEKVIVTDEGDVPRWGREYTKSTDIFTFDDNLRGHFENLPDDPADPVRKLTMKPEGRNTHVIIETDDGQSILIRKTNSEASASKQTFDVLSTSKEAGRAGQPAQRRELDTSMLRGVVAVPGEPLILGADPQTGKHVKTRGLITRITAFDMNEAVDSRHPKLQQSDIHRNTVQAFSESMRAARSAKVVPQLGSSAIKNS